jgi:hypothetical protein
VCRARYEADILAIHIGLDFTSCQTECFRTSGCLAIQFPDCTLHGGAKSPSTFDASEWDISFFLRPWTSSKPCAELQWPAFFEAKRCASHLSALCPRVTASEANCKPCAGSCMCAVLFREDFSEKTLQSRTALSGAANCTELKPVFHAEVLWVLQCHARRPCTEHAFGCTY